MDTQEIGYQTNLTSRQVCSIVAQFPTPPLEKDRWTGGAGVGDHTLYVCWNEDEEHAEERRKAAINEYYKLTPAMHKTVMDSLSSVGWMTVYDICSETGLPKDAVARIVRMSDNVEKEVSGRLRLYRKSIKASD